MKYIIESNLSERLEIIEQESYSKFRGFFLNSKLKEMNLLPLDLDLAVWLPKEYYDWEAEMRLQFRRCLSEKLSGLHWNFLPKIWEIYFLLDNVKRSQAYFNYVGVEYKIKESRVLTLNTFEYWSVLDLI